MDFIKTKSVYLSGQIKGLHIEEARKNFERASKNFDWDNTAIIHPIEYAEGLRKRAGRDLSESEILLAELKEIQNVEMVFMLRGWEKSKGATIEKLFAEYCGKIIMYEV